MRTERNALVPSLLIRGLVGVAIGLVVLLVSRLTLGESPANADVVVVLLGPAGLLVGTGWLYAVALRSDRQPVAWIAPVAVAFAGFSVLIGRGTGSVALAVVGGMLATALAVWSAHRAVAASGRP